MIDTSRRRVVITGYGLISPLGNTIASLWEALSQGTSGIGPLQLIPADTLPIQFGGEARQFTGQIEDFGELTTSQKRTIRKGLKVMCREIQMSVAATQRALQHAGLAEGDYDPERTGAVFGSDYIMTMPDEFAAGVRDCLDEKGNFQFSQWAERGMPKVTPLWLLKYLPNMPACHVAIYNDLRGPNNSITVREASANLAVAEAYSTIVRGSADVILCGATGSRIHPLRTVHTALQEELATEGNEPERLARPFDLHRQGMVVGEGAGTLVLEEAEFAQRRGATVLGEVVGYGSSSVMDSRAAARRDAAMQNAMRQAMASAQVSVEQIGHVHAHGLSTISCDTDEARAINQVFADRREAVPVTAAKSYFGNLGAASGLIELISSLLAMQHGRLFPTLNYETPDPNCKIRVITDTETPPGQYALNVNVSPQGQASAVVVRGNA